MNITQARTWIIVASMASSTAILVFFFVAPAVGYPLETGQSLQLLEIALPVFLGYLGSASHFLFRASAAPRKLGGTRKQLSFAAGQALIPAFPFNASRPGLTPEQAHDQVQTETEGDLGEDCPFRTGSRRGRRVRGPRHRRHRERMSARRRHVVPRDERSAPSTIRC